jgi:hypothetical protein
VEEDRIFRDVEGGLNAFGCYTIEDVERKNRFILNSLFFFCTATCDFIFQSVTPEPAFWFRCASPT